jgi:hypothetical protein
MTTNLVEETLSTVAVSATEETGDIDLNGAESLSVQTIITSNTPSAKTFDSGVAALLVVQDLTYTADTRGTAGNSITIAYTAGGTAGAEVVSVVGSAISVQIDTGVSTADQIKTAVDASVAASALISVTVSGTGTDAQVVAAATPLATGADSEVDTTTDRITIPSHGLPLGLKGQLTSTGTLPTGLALATDYFVIVIDANTIQLASSLANAEAGTAINITSQGSSGAVNTFTPTALAGATVQLQKSNDGTNWSNDGAAVAITGSGSVWIEKDRPPYRWARLQYTLTAGSYAAVPKVLVKG